MTSITDWASARPIQNRNAKDLLQLLASKADPDGSVPMTKPQMIAGCDDINTTGQADRALRMLMDGGLVSSRYDMSKYSHIYTLHVR